MTRLPTRPIIIAAVAIVLFGGPLRAGLVITADSATPSSGDVVLGFDSPLDEGGYLWAHGSIQETKIGQTFHLAAPATIDRITIRVRPVNLVAGQRVELWIGTFAGPSSPTMTAVLASDSGIMPADLVDAEPMYVTFAVPRLELDAARQYGFYLAFAGGGNDNANRAEVLHLGRDLYPDGTAFEKTSAFDTALAADLVFFLHGESEGQSDWLWSPSVPDYRFRVRITSASGDAPSVRAEAVCIPETLCVSGAVPGRSEVFLRVVGPKPNGCYWPTIVKFSTSQVEAWVERLATGDRRYYNLPAAVLGEDRLDGLFDRDGFQAQ